MSETGPQGSVSCEREQAGSWAMAPQLSNLQVEILSSNRLSPQVSDLPIEIIFRNKSSPAISPSKTASLRGDTKKTERGGHADKNKVTMLVDQASVFSKGKSPWKKGDKLPCEEIAERQKVEESGLGSTGTVPLSRLRSGGGERGAKRESGSMEHANEHAYLGGGDAERREGQKGSGEVIGEAFIDKSNGNIYGCAGVGDQDATAQTSEIGICSVKGQMSVPVLEGGSMEKLSVFLASEKGLLGKNRGGMGSNVEVGVADRRQGDRGWLDGFTQRGAEASNRRTPDEDLDLLEKEWSRLEELLKSVDDSKRSRSKQRKPYGDKAPSSANNGLHQAMAKRSPSLSTPETAGKNGSPLDSNKSTPSPVPRPNRVTTLSSRGWKEGTPPKNANTEGSSPSQTIFQRMADLMTQQDHSPDRCQIIRTQDASSPQTRLRHNDVRVTSRNGCSEDTKRVPGCSLRRETHALATADMQSSRTDYNMKMGITADKSMGVEASKDRGHAGGAAEQDALRPHSVDAADNGVHDESQQAPEVLRLGARKVIKEWNHRNGWISGEVAAIGRSSTSENCAMRDSGGMLELDICENSGRSRALFNKRERIREYVMDGGGGTVDGAGRLEEAREIEITQNLSSPASSSAYMGKEGIKMVGGIDVAEWRSLPSAEELNVKLPKIGTRPGGENRDSRTGAGSMHRRVTSGLGEIAMDGESEMMRQLLGEVNRSRENARIQMEDAFLKIPSTIEELAREAGKAPPSFVRTSMRGSPHRRGMGRKGAGRGGRLSKQYGASKGGSVANQRPKKRWNLFSSFHAAKLKAGKGGGSVTVTGEEGEMGREIAPLKMHVEGKGNGGENVTTVKPGREKGRSTKAGRSEGDGSKRDGSIRTLRLLARSQRELMQEQLQQVMTTTAPISLIGAPASKESFDSHGTASEATSSTSQDKTGKAVRTGSSGDTWSAAESGKGSLGADDGDESASLSEGKRPSPQIWPYWSGDVVVPAVMGRSGPLTERQHAQMKRQDEAVQNMTLSSWRSYRSAPLLGLSGEGSYEKKNGEVAAKEEPDVGVLRGQLSVEDARKELLALEAALEKARKGKVQTVEGREEEMQKEDGKAKDLPKDAGSEPEQESTVVSVSESKAEEPEDDSPPILSFFPMLGRGRRMFYSGPMRLQPIEELEGEAELDESGGKMATVNRFDTCRKGHTTSSGPISMTQVTRARSKSEIEEMVTKEVLHPLEECSAHPPEEGQDVKGEGYEQEEANGVQSIWQDLHSESTAPKSNPSGEKLRGQGKEDEKVDMLWQEYDENSFQAKMEKRRASLDGREAKLKERVERASSQRSQVAPESPITASMLNQQLLLGAGGLPKRTDGRKLMTSASMERRRPSLHDPHEIDYAGMRVREERRRMMDTDALSSDSVRATLVSLMEAQRSIFNHKVLLCGAQFDKHNRRGGHKLRFVWVADNLDFIYWADTKRKAGKASKMSIDSIMSIQRGRDTPFLSDPSRLLSIVGDRILDLEIPKEGNGLSLDKWVEVFQWLVQKKGTFRSLPSSRSISRKSSPASQTPRSLPNSSPFPHQPVTATTGSESPSPPSCWPFASSSPKLPSFSDTVESVTTLSHRNTAEFDVPKSPFTPTGVDTQRDI